LGRAADTEVQPSVSPARLCITCANEIPAARLKAIPNARQCVSCLSEAGDVSLIRRLDERVGSDIIGTYYCGDNYEMQHQEKRRSRNVPSARVLTAETEAPIIIPKVATFTEESTAEIISSLEILEITDDDNLSNEEKIAALNDTEEQRHISRAAVIRNRHRDCAESA
jgi:hypothetical protein